LWGDIEPAGNTREEISMPHANETVIRNLYDAFASREMTVVDKLLADDITWHAPGTAAHAGSGAARRICMRRWVGSPS